MMPVISISEELLRNIKKVIEFDVENNPSSAASPCNFKCMYCDHDKEVVEVLRRVDNLLSNFKK